MSGNVAMDAETVTQASIDTRNAKVSVDSNLDSLKTLCMDLQASWTGEGGRSFQNVMEKWDIHANKLLGALEEIADALDSSSEATAESDASSGSEISAFEGEL